MDFFSPLRYPGGKGKLLPFFERLLTDNGLNDGTYIEPYVGGGAVALSLLLREYVHNIIINDKDRSIYAFWHSVLYNVDKKESKKPIFWSWVSRHSFSTVLTGRELSRPESLAVRTKLATLRWMLVTRKKNSYNGYDG